MTELLRILGALLQRLGKTIGRLNNTLLLTISFYGVFLPIALLRRLARRPEPPPRWLKRDPLEPKHFRRQF